MTKPSRKIMEEAAEWLTTMQETPLSKSQEIELFNWRSQSPAHEQAWQTAQNFMGMMDAIPSKVGRKIWGRDRVDRRAAIKALASVMLLAPVAKIAWDKLPGIVADYRTKTGETRKIELPDGSVMHLNTASSINVNFTDNLRVVELVEGEILIETTKTPKINPNAPFIVQTQAGHIRALGTRFSIRKIEDQKVKVNVYEHAVAIKPATATTESKLLKSKSVIFTPVEISPATDLKQLEPSWVSGQIISENMPLGELLNEIARYRTGFLRCDPTVAHHRISGVFQLSQTDVALNVIANTLPVRIHSISPYFVLVTEK
ncbi:FecR domain-containing protein [Curvivirga sp.]|uniref:FecR domain-containing protein n=1 Tax=Curvivirga sp. TaxID=2856848 RepID=UPI003B59F6EA